MKRIPASFARAAAAFAISLAAVAAQADDAYVYSTDVSSNGGEGSSVNIGYYMKATSRIEVDFQYPETPTKDVLFGAWGDTGNSSATPGLRMAFWNNGGVYSFILDSGSFMSYSSSVALDTARHTAVIDAPNRAFRILASDGTVEWSGSVASGRDVSGEATWPIALFGCAKNAAGQGNQHTKARIYSVKIYETENGVETLVCDFVPCMKNDDAGFYDNKSGSFHYRQGSLGSLVCGGDNVKTIRDAYLETPSSNKSVEKISFNTGYFMKTNSWLAVDFQWLGTPADLLFGPYDDGAMLTTAFWCNSGAFAFLYKPTGGFANYQSVARDNNRHTAIIDARNGSLRLLDRFGNVQWSNSTGAAAVNNAAWPIVLFGATSNASGGGKQWSYARIFSAKFYEGDDPNPVMDFVPYVKDGAAGFMEQVSGVFKEAKGVSAGGDVEYNKCSYIENDGSTVLNLGYRANMKSRIEVDYMCLNPSVDGKVLFGAWNGGSLRYVCWNSGSRVKFIFHGKSSPDPQYASSYAPDALRHTAIMDMMNQHIYYLTGNVTNYSQTATAGTFNSTDTSYPMGVFGSISNDAGTNCDNMTAKSRFYSVRIYEDEELVHEFLPYTDGTTVSLRDVITGHVATKVKSTFAEPTISGMGADGEEQWFVRPQDASIGGKPLTLKAAAVGAVLRYKWTFNGEAISGGENGELVVSWRKTRTPDVYAVTPVYSVGGAEIEGAAVSATVEYLPLGTKLIVK